MTPHKPKRLFETASSLWHPRSRCAVRALRWSCSLLSAITLFLGATATAAETSNPLVAVRVDKVSDPYGLVLHRAEIPRQELENMRKVDPAIDKVTTGLLLVLALKKVDSLSTTGQPLAGLVEADESLRHAFLNFRQYERERTNEAIRGLEEQARRNIEADITSEESKKTLRRISKAWEKFYSESYPEALSTALTTSALIK